MKGLKTMIFLKLSKTCQESSNATFKCQDNKMCYILIKYRKKKKKKNEIKYSFQLHYNEVKLKLIN